MFNEIEATKEDLQSNLDEVQKRLKKVEQTIVEKNEEISILQQAD